VPARGASAGTSVLLGLLLTGCGHTQSFIGETPAITDTAKSSASGPDEPPPLGEASASIPADFPSCPPVPPESPPQAVWGVVGMRGFPVGQQMASNGVEYNPLFLLDLDFNLMLWRQQRVYLFFDAGFWGQKAAPGVTNPSQGSFDFSKREFDFNVGAAWNYAGPWEARFFGYSFNNLNRGNSQTSPSGFNDGIGLENRYYVGETYANLGTAAFDQARATFLSVGFYPSKTMVDGNGNQFRPGAFARAYLTWDLWGEKLYLFGDAQLIAGWSFRPELLNLDAGLAARPFASIPRFEFRVGTLDMLSLRGGDLETELYLAIRYVF
jgi:hypothetical protein